MMQNNWQDQSKHIIATSSSNEMSHNEQHLHHIQDLFGRSTERPISAPPSSNNSAGIMNGLGRSSQFPSSPNGEPWGDKSNSLYTATSPVGVSTADNSPTNSKHAFHLSDHFNFDHLKSSNDVNSGTSDPINRIGAESVPPGLGLFPIDTNNNSHSLSSDKLFHDKTFDVMQIGSRRPASTGLIGHNHRTYTSSSVMESLGLISPDTTHSYIHDANNDITGSTAATGVTTTSMAKRKQQKPIMDLIQEDFERPPSPEYQREDHLGRTGGSVAVAPSTARSTNTGSNVSNVPAPTNTAVSSTSTPSSIQYNVQKNSSVNVDGTPPSLSVGSYSSSSQHNFVTGINRNFEDNQNMVKHHIYPNHADLQTRVPHGFHQQDINSIHSSHHHDTSRLQGTYQAAPIPAVHQHQHHHVMHQHQSTYDHQHQPVYYNTQRRNEVVTGHPPPHRVLQPGHSQAPHSIYINSPPPPYGGYATVQYHQGPPPQNFPHHGPVVIHSHDPSMTPRYISALPVQGHTIPAQVQPNGAYIYFHQPTNGPTINIVPTSHDRVTTSRGGQYNNKTSSKNGGGGSNGSSAADRTSRKGHRMKNSKSASSVVSSDSHVNSASSVLEEFRADKNRSWTAFDVKGHIVEFCQDQNGSRFIQQRLEVAGDDEKILIMTEVLPEINKLRIDIFGNYVVQKLFDFGTPEMVEKVKQTIVGDMLTLSNQIYGCRVVQKALEIVNDDALLDLLSEIHGYVLSCIHDQNGNHVIQKCIEVVNKRIHENESKGNLDMANQFKTESQSILDCVTEDVLALSCHPYGCRVFQRILEHFDEKQKDNILDCISGFHQELLDDQYGNYVIQHVLRFGRTSDRDSVLDFVMKNGLLHLSRQKFASNVVEKLLKYGNDNHRKAIVREMLQVVQISGMDGSVEESSVVLMMVRDAYANYVVQTTLDVVPEGEEKRMLFKELNNHAALLRNFTFAKHIITKLGTCT
eukprot:CAMPEP_0203669102 /NCGR_PEP_ID=MMETSP0090-20130426/5559_1 /ASSEMBLY_ACC=CAM_ASM_001088 /TAXON_ID=426623 /ORGANISM="Chaetoceros affinis, Strain CCMP159" /LENGTH=969 /DNA_ID=CAMNT_0050533703 /DNA_START=610 /DNA_END=3522 /DNA_ORIENTATION=+